MQKVALVTGASRGIGRVIAQNLAKNGITVAVHYASNSDQALLVAQTIQSAGGTAFTVQGDIGSLSGIDHLYQELDRELVNRFGNAQFDILVNNAGIAPPSTIENTDEETFDRVFAVNLKGPFFIIQKALPRLRDGGRIINISTSAARQAFPSLAAYSPTKGAINTLTLLLAEHLGPRNITVNAIAPGLTETEMVAEMVGSAEIKQLFVNTTALRRLGQPEDIADVVAYFASDASRWVTGQIIDATGGYRL